MKKIIFWLFIIAIPFVSWSIFTFSSWELVPFIIQQIYYIPLSWLGKPFFLPSQEVGFWVTGYGRGLGVIIYSLFYWGLWYGYTKIKSNNKVL
ncbi:MAG: hypothetical protein ACC657_17010 [Thiohalomonadales bacterium]